MLLAELAYPDEILFIRHAQSEGNVMTLQERSLSPLASNRYALTELGRQQAAMTRDWLAENYGGDAIYRIFASYYKRTCETADICFPGREIRQDPRLAERDRGIEHVLTREQLLEQFPFEAGRLEASGPYHFRPIAGESWTDMERRVREFLLELRLKYAGTKVAVVTHAHWLLLLQKVLEGWSIEQIEQMHREHRVVANVSILCYRNQTDPKTGCSKLVHDSKNDYIIPWKGKLPEGANLP